MAPHEADAPVTMARTVIADELAYAAEIGREIAERYRLLAERSTLLDDDAREDLIAALEYAETYDADLTAARRYGALARLLDQPGTVVVLPRQEAG